MSEGKDPAKLTGHVYLDTSNHRVCSSCFLLDILYVYLFHLSPLCFFLFFFVFVVAVVVVVSAVEHAHASMFGFSPFYNSCLARLMYDRV